MFAVTEPDTQNRERLFLVKSSSSIYLILCEQRNMQTELIDAIRTSWKWTGVDPAEIVEQNEFGNLIIKDTSGTFWRLCPEEVYCEVVAKSAVELGKLLRSQEFLSDWQMSALVDAAKESIGPLSEGRKYCFVIPGVLGGAYHVSNLRSAPLIEIILFSGDIGKQISDLPDGAQVSFKVVE